MKPSEKREKFILKFLDNHSNSPVASNDVFEQLIIKGNEKHISEASIENELFRYSNHNDGYLGFKYDLNVHGSHITPTSATSTWLSLKGEDRLYELKRKHLFEILRVVQNWVWPIVVGVIVYCLNHLG